MRESRLYLDWLTHSIPSIIKQWVGENVIQSGVKGDFQQTISNRIESYENACRYAEACPIDGIEPDSYRLREINYAGDLSILAGIHFRGRDLNFPFVGVYAQSREITSDEAISLSVSLSEEFALFAPQYVWWWSSLDQFDLRSVPGAVEDQRLLVGYIPEIVKQLPSQSGRSTMLKPDPEIKCYDRYCMIYEQYLEENPDWRGRLPLTEREEFRECVAANGFYTLSIEGEFAGLIAARPGNIRGIDGWEMMEEILAKPFRGKGIAPVMQRLFLEQLDSNLKPLVLGTIDSQNIPSLKTAIKVGRKDVGGWVFVPV